MLVVCATVRNVGPKRAKRCPMRKNCLFGTTEEFCDEAGGERGRLHDNVEKAIRPFNGAPSALHACSSSPILSLMFFSTE